MANAFSIIDSHCHLDGFYRRGELEVVLQQAKAAGVDRMISIGTSEDDWSLYAGLNRRYPNVIDFTVGLHPCNVDESWEEQVVRLPAFFASSQARPVGVGEIGLDYFHLPKKDPEKAERLKAMQTAAFRQQLELVRELDCPVVIHSRGAFDDCIRELKTAKVNGSKVVFHCFVENGQAIRTLNELGGRGSFTGIITFKNADDVREAAVSQGLDKLMVETDAPYLAPEPHRGQPCFPAYTALTAKYCARLLEISERDLAEATRKNTEDFFELA